MKSSKPTLRLSPQRQAFFARIPTPPKQGAGSQSLITASPSPWLPKLNSQMIIGSEATTPSFGKRKCLDRDEVLPKTKGQKSAAPDQYLDDNMSVTGDDFDQFVCLDEGEMEDMVSELVFLSFTPKKPIARSPSNFSELNQVPDSSGSKGF